MEELKRLVFDAAMAYMRARNWDQSDLASYLGEANSATITNWKARGVPSAKIYSVAKMIEYEIPGLKSNVGFAPEINGNVPLIDWVRAGDWCEATDPFEKGDAESWMICPVKHGDKTFALKVRGLSMFNPDGKHSYSDGDIIFVDPSVQPLNGSRVIVRMEDNQSTTFKELVIGEDGRKFLRPLNPRWPDPIIEVNERATICGIVIGKWVPE